jgi:5'-nucleotidase
MSLSNAHPSRRRSRRWLAAAAAATLTLGLVATATSPAEAGTKAGDGHRGHHHGHGNSRTVSVQLLSFNDYHGHLESTTPGAVSVDGADVPAGGAEFLSTHLSALRKGHRNSLTVAAGDLIGGSPFLSGLFHDEPSVESLNALGLDVSSVGNHEFDEGVTELKRMQDGGCHPTDGCYIDGEVYPGADFTWLAANVKNARGRTPLPPYWIKRVQGQKIGFIGMTLEGTDALVAQAGIRGWDFMDEVETANALVPKLRRKGVQAIVVLLHEGGIQSGTYDQCVGISGPIVQIAENLHPEIDALITGHTHQPYNCSIPDPRGRPRAVTSAFSFGRIISEMNLKISKRTGDVNRGQTRVVNHVVTQDVAPDPVETSIIAKWKSLSDVVGNVVVGQVAESLTRRGDRQLESDLGNAIADAQLWATTGNGAQIALMNPGGVRADLTYDSPAGTGGDVSYAEMFNVQPFGNLLSTIPMTGDQIQRVLEQQCQPAGSSRPVLFLGLSEGLTYTFDRTIDAANNCTAVSVTDLALNGTAIDPTTTYQVTVNNFLVDGGDNFSVFAEVDPSLRIGGGVDLDAFIAYLGANSPLPSPGIDRVTEVFAGG